jgi:hypothetical protein
MYIPFIVECKITDAQFFRGRSISFFYNFIQVVLLIKNVGQNIIYWEIHNNVNCEWKYIFMLFQHCNLITWKHVPR